MTRTKYNGFAKITSPFMGGNIRSHFKQMSNDTKNKRERK